MGRKGHKQNMRANTLAILKGFRLASGILTAPSPKRIKKLTFAVTYRCNSECTFCNIWEKYRENSALLRREMSLVQIKKIFSNSNALRKLEKIAFTGGEPFLRRDFAELFLFIYRRYPNSFFDITTSGQTPALIKKDLTKILSTVDPSRLNFLVSLDGLKKTHDKLRGRVGTFETTEETLNLVRVLSDSVRLIISFTISPSNYRELLDVYYYAQSRGFLMTMRFADMNNDFYYNTNGNRNGWRAEDLLEAKSQVFKVIEEIQKKRGLMSKITNSDIYFFEKMIDYKFQPRRIQSCFSGTHSLFLDPYGMAYPCISLNKCIGSVLDDGFDNIWCSPRASEIRKFIAHRSCHCWTDCESFSSIQRNPKYIASNLKKQISGMLSFASRKAEDA